jgi:hypothetical protein
MTDSIHDTSWTLFKLVMLVYAVVHGCVTSPNADIYSQALKCKVRTSIKIMPPDTDSIKEKTVFMIQECFIKDRIMTLSLSM